MADASATAATEPDPQPSPLRRLARNVLLFFAVQTVVSSIMGNLFTPTTQPEDMKRLPASRNAMAYGTPLELSVYVTEGAELDVNATRAWAFSFDYGDWEMPTARAELNFTPGVRVTEQNGTLHLHVLACPRATDALLQRAVDCVAASKLLTPIFPLPPADTGRRRLLAGSYGDNDEKSPDAEVPSGGGGEPDVAVFVAHWNPVLHLSLVTDDAVLPHRAQGLPPAVISRLQFDDIDARYHPVISFNEFWDLREDWQPINSSTPILTLNLTVTPISLMKWQMLVQMDESFSVQEQWGAQTAHDKDNFKKMLRDTNPYLLALTFAVTLLHSVFDFLAFKNDVSFWRNRKTMAGLSLRSIFLSVVCQFIILLYLFDQPETSKIILVSGTIGLLIECWKLKRAAVFAIHWVPTSYFPRVTFTGQGDYAGTTSEHDKQAFVYLSRLLGPLFLCYTAYSLLYKDHSGWYSFIISTLAGGVYTFGFIMMTPQLFINYKLKSVAHLPWRMLTYKALNTFVDDLFAFVIHMPLMHRLACFRDDIIFFVYLYQRWIYRMDPTRQNEYGVSGEDLQSPAAAEADPAPLRASLPDAAGEAAPSDEQQLRNRKARPVAREETRHQA